MGTAVTEKTKAQIAIDWIERNLIIPDGDYVGDKFKLAEFQKNILIDIYDNDVPIRKAIISMGRGAAKSTLCACILALYLVGPFVKQNTQLVSTALTKEQAGLTYELLVKMLLMNGYFKKYIHVRDFKKQIVNKKLRITYTALSADVKDKQGGAAYVAVHDEVGSIKGPTSALLNAVDYGMAKNKESISFYISTQAEADTDYFSQLIDTYKEGVEPSVYVKVFACPEDVDPFSEEALEYHPAFNEFADKESIRIKQREAKLMPNELARFRQFYLNQRVDADSAFINPEVWNLNGEEPEDWKNKDVIVALDLSMKNDLTSMTLMFRNDNNDKLSIVPFFYLPEAAIKKRPENERPVWQRWVSDGKLIQIPGESVEYSYVAEQLSYINQHARIIKVVFDPWNIKYFKRDLIEKGFTEHWIDEYLHEFRQNVKDMSPAIRELENMIVNQRLAHGNHPVLTMCFKNVKVKVDSGITNNRMFQKKSSDRKIDGAITTAMCAGAWHDFGTQPKPKSYLFEEDLFVI